MARRLNGKVLGESVWKKLLKNPHNIKTIRDPSEEMIKYALDIDISALKHVDEVPLSIYKWLFKEHLDPLTPQAIHFLSKIDNQEELSVLIDLYTNYMLGRDYMDPAPPFVSIVQSDLDLYCRLRLAGYKRGIFHDVSEDLLLHGLKNKLIAFEDIPFELRTSTLYENNSKGTVFLKDLII